MMSLTTINLVVIYLFQLTRGGNSQRSGNKHLLSYTTIVSLWANNAHT